VFLDVTTLKSFTSNGSKSSRFQRKDTGRKVELSDSVFAIEPNNHAVYLDVKQYLAKRQGTHKAKERAEKEVHVRLKQKELVLLVRVVQRTV
jgi:ribosomal protein L4